jgi:opacity protein-like surface antigen
MTLRRVALVIGCCAFAARASAQVSSDTGVFASVAASVSTIGRGVPVALSGGIGYRLAPIFGLGVEVTVIPSLTPRARRGPDLGFGRFSGGSVDFEEDGGRAVVFTSTARFEWPLGSTRVRPYIIGGGGVGQVRERVRAKVSLGPAQCPPGLLCPQVVLGQTTVGFGGDSTDLALTIGGGVSIHARGPMSIDVEGRYLGLLGRRDDNVGRFGGGLTFRF